MRRFVFASTLGLFVCVFLVFNGQSIASTWLDANGNVGIGTTSPQSKLAVNGTITTKEVKVTDVGWADFVFKEDYKLLPLEKVETYIKSNKRLPDIPSAQEVKEKGLAVSEMMVKHMQKIEELTRYLIELKKENDILKNRISALEKMQSAR